MGDGDAAKGKAVIDVVWPEGSSCQEVSVPRRGREPFPPFSGRYHEGFALARRMGRRILRFDYAVLAHPAFWEPKFFPVPAQQVVRGLRNSAGICLYGHPILVAIAVKRKEQLRVLMLMDTLEKAFPASGESLLRGFRALVRCVLCACFLLQHQYAREHDPF